MQGSEMFQRRGGGTGRGFPILLALITTLLISGTLPGQEAPIPNYYLPGSVRVTVEPAQAAAQVLWQVLVEKDAGGEWVVDEKAWLASGQTRAGLPPGRHPIAFRAAAGLVAPGSREASIASAAAVTETVAKVDASDAVAILGFLFLDVANPPAPFGACGADPTAGALTCAAYGFCGQ